MNLTLKRLKEIEKEYQQIRKKIASGFYHYTAEQLFLDGSDLEGKKEATLQTLKEIKIFLDKYEWYEDKGEEIEQYVNKCLKIMR